MNQHKLFFVAHTHWDREWYRSFEVFRKHFVQVLEDYLDFLEKNPEVPSFTLDGQTSLIEDYLEIKPEDQHKIKKFVQEGKLKIGPWYTSLEPSLVGGEALVRNLLMGDRTARQWGKNMKIGYIPDTGRIISQFPQIMRLSGIPHVIFTRGLGDETVSTEYELKGADGTGILATYQVKAYNNGGYLPEDPEELLERIKSEVDKISEFAISPWILINQGGDHHPPQKNLLKIFNILKESGNYQEIKWGGFDDYYETVKPLLPPSPPCLAGELWGSREYPIMSGIFSNRADFKLLNANIENRILRFIEPLSVISLMTGGKYPETTLQRVWKLLLQNHHHNTICGVVSDAVYHEAMIRFQKIEDLIDELWKDSVRGFALKGSAPSEKIPVLAINTLPSTRQGPVGVRWITPHNNHRMVGIQDEKGQEIPCQVLKVKKLEGNYPYPSRMPLKEVELLFTGEEIPALGYKTYYIYEKHGEEEEESPVYSQTISNEFFEVGFEPAGTFYIKETATGKEWGGLNRFSDEADSGDTYNFSPLPGDIPLMNCVRDMRMEVLIPGELQKTLQMSGTLSLPVGLDKNRKERKNEWVSCPFVLQISLFKGIPLVDCVLHLENRAEDHRLRIAFPHWGDEGFVRVGQPFDLLSREIPLPIATDWIEKPSPTQPFREILDVRSPEGSLALFSGGIQEYEVIRREKSSEIMLTLVRSVGWLSREDNIFRKVEVAPKMPVPTAQCKKEMHYHYALVPHRGDEDLHQIIALWQRYRTPLTGAVVRRGEKIPSIPPGIELKPDYLVVSSCKKAEEREGIILRFYNPTDVGVSAQISTCGRLKSCRRVNLLEEPISSFSPVPLEIGVNPKEIVSIEFNYSSSK